MVIEVKNLTRSFKIPKKEEPESILGKLRQMMWPRQTKIMALDGISFKVKKGDIFGYLGPNGAGKSTTIKILTGILTPDSGEVNCLGYVPWKQRGEYTKNIGIVFGQRSLLWWDIPVIESLRLYKDIYEVSDPDFKERLDYYSEMLDIGKLLNIQVRKLSLGERMKCEVTASLLHNPKIVFLDEPTIGVDAVARENIISFIKDVNREFKTTVFLTTHYMGDVEELCKRIIVLDKGKKVYEGKLSKFKDRYIKDKVVEIDAGKFKNQTQFNKLIQKFNIIEIQGNHFKISVPANGNVTKLFTDLTKCCEVLDITIKEPNLEKIIATMYRGMR